MQEIRIPLEQYKSLRDELRLYVGQLLTIFTVFFTFATGLTGFALIYPEARWTIMFVPILLLTVGFLISSRTYTSALLSRRIRDIEEQINAMYSKPLLCWESRYAKRFIFPSVVRLPSSRRMLNPVLATTLLSVVAFITPFTYALIKSYEFMPGYLYWPYARAVNDIM